VDTVGQNILSKSLATVTGTSEKRLDLMISLALSRASAY
jgi:hypothetical protein